MTAVDSASRRLTPLIGREGRRLARHPVLWLAPVIVVATLGALVLFGRFDNGVWWMWRTTETTLADRPPVLGNPWLHAAYLAGLCACAMAAAVYRDRTQWRRLALVGGPVLVATLALGWLQLP